MSEADLTDKQRVFVEEYLTCWNAAEAARRAGYPEASARQIGSENLSKPDIRALIDQRMKEKAMSADEVLARLNDHATADMNDFITITGRGFRYDLARAKREGKLHLIRKIVKGKQGTAVELVDQQAALIQIAKIHRLLVDRVEHSGKVSVKEDAPDLSKLSTEELEQWIALMQKLGNGEAK
jgi:hypothetical protein